MMEERKYDWIIAVSDSNEVGVELEKVTKTADDVTKYLSDRIRRDKENDLENFSDGSEDEDSLEQVSMYETGEVIELNGYNDFEGYRINYTAKRLDIMSF